jgi:hypothetical protein
MRGLRLLAILGLATLLSGCGVVAAPCRVGSAVLDMVPLVGHVAAAPTDACAQTIDPD